MSSVSVQSDAATIRELARKIVQAEILKAQITSQGGAVFLDDEGDISVTLTNQQKQAALAVEDGWKQQIKTISAAW